jgi:hypothetical protein
MGEVQIIGYHTCERGTNPRYTKENAPFHCNIRKEQWLGHGYYFWTDSEFFAKKWGEDRYGANYAIVKCTLKFEKSLLLDLVGNVDDQIQFSKLTKFYQDCVSSPEAQAKLPPDKRGKRPTVNTIIEHFQRLAQTEGGRIFPYRAIKAQDWDKKSGEVSFCGNYDEKMPALTRQQLCLFTSYKSCIVEKEFIYPPLFTM